MRFYKLRKYFWHFFIPDRKRKMRAKAITENHYLSTDKIVPIANIYYYNWRWECVVRLESRTSFKYNKTDCLLLYAFIILLISFCYFLFFPYSLFSLFSNHSFLIPLTFLMIPMLLSQLFFRPLTWYTFTRAHFSLLLPLSFLLLLLLSMF